MANISVTASTHPQHKDITLVSVKGFIDTNTAPEFDKTFQSVLSEKKYNLIIDLKDASYISSAGWGIFVGEIKRIRNQKGNLFLVSMNPEVMEAYELLQFSTILKAFPTVDQAVKKGFGKTGNGKEAVMNPTVSVSGKTMEMAQDEPAIAAKVKKTPLLVRILLPWKWF